MHDEVLYETTDGYAATAAVGVVATRSKNEKYSAKISVFYPYLHILAAESGRMHSNNHIVFSERCKHVVIMSPTRKTSPPQFIIKSYSVAWLGVVSE